MNQVFSHAQSQKIANLIKLWKSRGLSIHGKVSIIKAILLPKMIYASSFLSTPATIIKEFNALVFSFLWNGNERTNELYLRVKVFSLL